jgi:hypothetical protein
VGEAIDLGPEAREINRFDLKSHAHFVRPFVCCGGLPELPLAMLGLKSLSAAASKQGELIGGLPGALSAWHGK